MPNLAVAAVGAGLQAFTQANAHLWGQVDPIDGIPLRPPVEPTKQKPKKEHRRDRRHIYQTEDGLRWTVKIRWAGRLHTLGRFDELADAQRARDEFKKQHGITGRSHKDRIHQLIDKSGAEGRTRGGLKRHGRSESELDAAIRELVAEGKIELRDRGKTRRYYSLVALRRASASRTAAEERQALAERLHALLLAAGESGISHWQLAETIGTSINRIGHALKVLERSGRAVRREELVNAFMERFRRIWYAFPSSGE